MFHRAEIGAEARAAEVVKRRNRSARGGPAYRRQERCYDALSCGLADDAEPDRG